MNDDAKYDRLGRLAYSVEEAAEVIGLGKTTLYNLMNSGELRSCKIGNRRVIRAVDLDALIAGRSQIAA